MLGCTSSNPRTSKIHKSMSQNGDPKMAISTGTYSIKGPDVGFMRGCSICIYIYMHACMHAHTHARTHACVYTYKYIYAQRCIRSQIFQVLAAFQGFLDVGSCMPAATGSGVEGSLSKCRKTRCGSATNLHVKKLRLVSNNSRQLCIQLVVPLGFTVFSVGRYVYF